MPAWLYWAINMGLFDRFKSDKAPTQQLSAIGLAQKGVDLSQLNRDQEAIQCYDKALKIDPQHANSWTLKGASLSKLNRDQEALPCFDNALKIDSKNATA